MRRQRYSSRRHATPRWTRHGSQGLDHRALLHPVRRAAIDLQERDELAFRLRIALNVALRHGQAGMAREFLHVPEAPPDLGHFAGSARNEGTAAGV